MTGNYDAKINPDWNCYRSLVNFFEKKCGKVEENALKHFKYFYEYCSAENVNVNIGLK